MKLLVLGASGGCGRWIVNLARQRGHSVRVVVRTETAFEDTDDIEIIYGSVLREEILKEGLKNCDAVLSALGIKRKIL